MRIAIFIMAISLLNGWACGADDTIIADFEGGTYGEWTATGNAFGSAPATGKLGGQQDVSGYRGNGLINTFRNGDKSTGTLTSPPFQISHPYISFLIGGGKHPASAGAELLIDGKAIHRAAGKNQEMLSWHTWDVSDLRGKSATIRVFDQSTDGFGHINVDHFIATDKPRRGPGVLRLADYAKTTDYYNERYRPQFHFTPPMNWMNDPNGLVYFDGEYHLFYQHNPHGNSWGHMSWGHAVSSDLVHWEHLPIALHEEYGVMIFSGCCVVDWKDSSGFGEAGRPPMVAIYTGHGLGKQTQDIAYSNDRGRTWTKYSGNPVIDKNEADFRDPKVFWHEPTQKWVMVVSMANAKYVQFYSSENLKSWEHLSDFGPAGVKDKPNWECPDLFELPVEGHPGKTKWVLEVDMGNGSVAGGSGGEYFVGEFDGREFKCDHDPNKSQWVDYGRDFYAPVSFSDIPDSDGRRIWIGWMNNWETALLPTRPWRSAMSIPRVLSLRKSLDGFKMVQQPVAELTSLRGKHFSKHDTPVNGIVALTDTLQSQGIKGDRLEILATVKLRDASEFGFKVRTGPGEETVVGNNTSESRLFVDRTRSGDSSFHDKFAGKHDGPLAPKDGTVTLRIYLDDSSIEVFGGDGETVITDRIFPDPKSCGLCLYADGGEATFVQLDIWSLKSIWHTGQQ